MKTEICTTHNKPMVSFWTMCFCPDCVSEEEKRSPLFQAILKHNESVCWLCPYHTEAVLPKPCAHRTKWVGIGFCRDSALGPNVLIWEEIERALKGGN